MSWNSDGLIKLLWKIHEIRIAGRHHKSFIKMRFKSMKTIVKNIHSKGSIKCQ